MDNFFDGFGIKSGEILHVTPKETLELCKKGAVLVDVREDYLNRFKIFDVDELIFCPLSILADSYNDLPQNKPLIFADAVGLRSKEAVQFLQLKEITNIANMAGGIVGWERSQLPIVIDESERLTGSCLCMLRLRDRKKK